MVHVMHPILRCLLTCLCYLPGALTASSASDQRLSYVASYQGLLSAGIPVDIAGLDLSQKPETPGTGTEAVQVTLSTQAYGAAEFFMPVRFCYRSRVQRESGATMESHWWSRIGAKASHGRLEFDQDRKQVTRLHVARKLESYVDARIGWEQNAGSETLDLDKHMLPFPEGASPMDQLSMMMWLRRQQLNPGDTLQIPVTNGKYLTGYRVAVEGDEEIDWHGRPTPSTRLRLEPQVNDDHDTDPTWLWIGRDERRLPLRFRSIRRFGRFDLTLLAQAASPEMACHIPESASLQLPE